MTVRKRRASSSSMALPTALDRARERGDAVVIDPGCMTSPAAESARVQSGEAEDRFPIWWKRPFSGAIVGLDSSPPDPNACFQPVSPGAQPIAKAIPPPTMPGNAFLERGIYAKLPCERSKIYASYQNLTTNRDRPIIRAVHV